jgi:hypothetical protein
LVLGVAACGGSDDDSESKSSDSASDQASDSADSSGDDSGSSSDTGVEADVDACALYSVEDMAKQMGADDVTAQMKYTTPPTCEYVSKAHYLTAELAVLDAQMMAAQPRDPAALLPEGSFTDDKMDVSGIGDEVFGFSSFSGANIAVRTGETGYSLLITNAGGGADAGNWKDAPAMEASAKAIMTAVVDGK